MLHARVLPMKLRVTCALHAIGLLGVALACAPAGSQQRPTAPERPNFVIVLVDDLRWDDLAIAGHPFVETPAIAPAGSTPAELVQAIDLAPTKLELAAIADPTPREGRSLVPLLRGERPSWRTSLLIEYCSDTVFPRIRNMAYQAVRTERHKYIHYLELDGMDEVYDLQADPYELDNLIDSDRGRDVLPALRAELARLTAGAVRPPPGRN
jgi:arylsulfatase A-like enzyme